VSQVLQSVLLAESLLQQDDLSLLSQVAQSFLAGQVHEASVRVAVATTRAMMFFIGWGVKKKG
jgi:hypothetical protein